MTDRRTRDKFGQPRTTFEEASQINSSARNRREQMLPGHGPDAPEKDPPVAHYKGPESEVELGPAPPDLPVEAEDPDEDA